VSRTDDALAALESRDWSSAEPVSPPASMPMAVVATRLPVELVEQLAREAERRGLTPSTLLRQFAEEALQPVPDTATVRLVDVVRAVESLARHAA
jgi:hypothetical protein